ncbi:GTPase ObgE [Candidatus Cyanaurora vandensis]|uniref:GTPase ObgE n=1 Tax=Candidatus Cyanaurora vandensis TaxID=2714958 RepID=UPI00257E301A|nr:GTPase ObgE [Candidatus Cyanaurora vandensis]
MQFIDQAEIQVIAGRGGDGMVAYRREKYVPAGGPAGGDGGNGGSVWFVGTTNLQTLLDIKYRHILKAPEGERGGPKNMTGAQGKDLIIGVPCGTLVRDMTTDTVLGDVTEPDQYLLVAKGGKGGYGNVHFASNNNRAPEFATEGKPGEERELLLELKLLAEVGIIGLPNAGKSTLISVLSAARPKIADYPFTTLIPNLGVVRREGGDGVVFADIPGLIAGAHLGVGLGHDFLRHIERTRLLLHVVDLTSLDPRADFDTVQEELLAYGHGLPQRPQILVLNKYDSVQTEDTDQLAAPFTDVNLPKVIISAASRHNLETLLRLCWQGLDQLSGVYSLS